MSISAGRWYRIGECLTHYDLPQADGSKSWFAKPYPAGTREGVAGRFRGAVVRCNKVSGSGASGWFWDQPSGQNWPIHLRFLTEVAAPAPRRFRVTLRETEELSGESGVAGLVHRGWSPNGPSNPLINGGWILDEVGSVVQWKVKLYRELTDIWSAADERAVRKLVREKYPNLIIVKVDDLGPDIPL